MESDKLTPEQANIIILQGAKKAILKTFDIIISEEEEKHYYKTLQALNDLINYKIKNQ